MSLYVLDTDILSLYQRGHVRVVQRTMQHLTHRLAITVVSIHEQLVGWQTASSRARDDLSRANAYLWMAQTVRVLSGWEILPFSLQAMSLHEDLLRRRLNVGSNDLKIAAIALDLGGIVVTRNARNFGRVAGLSLSDWTI